MSDIEIEKQITSKDIDESWLFLNSKTLNATRGDSLSELFDNQQKFIAAYNEWVGIKSDLEKSNETEYLSYMNLLESRNYNLESALTLQNVSFDAKLKTISKFIKKQANAFGHIFPFSSDEIVGWDSNNFIVRDSIYYSITGKYAVFYLARIDKDNRILL
jgi:hypothetical protein